MMNFFTIWRRELSACFLSPIAYVTLVVFLLVAGCLFCWQVLSNQTAYIMNEGVGDSLVEITGAILLICLTMLITVVCMRLFAEERRSGTIEALMTVPVTELSIVMGKYAGALSFVVIAMLPVLANIFVLTLLSPGMKMSQVDLSALTGAVILLLLLSMFWIALGLLISLTTKNQIVAAICILCSIWLVVMFSSLLAGFKGMDRGALELISVETHVQDFCRGSLDSRPVVMYISGTIFLLFASVRLLESRRWR